MNKHTSYVLFVLTLSLLSCHNLSTPQETNSTSTEEAQIIRASTPEYIIKNSWGQMLEQKMLKGCILVYDQSQDKFYTNDSTAMNTGYLPASTFKIPNTIIGLETHSIDKDHTFIWDQNERSKDMWEKDLKLKDAFQVSCVPCYQELAREIGIDTMSIYLHRLDFGNMKVDANTIDNFWLTGNSKISCVQQIDFLKRLINRELPISESTRSTMMNILALNSTDTYSLSGKTGWSINANKHNGWFVGYLQIDEKNYYFSTNITPQTNFDMSTFSKIRKEITWEALIDLGLIK